MNVNPEGYNIVIQEVFNKAVFALAYHLSNQMLHILT